MMPTEKVLFELPGKLDGFLAFLSNYYADKGERLLQAVLVNARVRVHEDYTYDPDNWDGEIHGHAIYLQLPPEVYQAVFDDLENVTNELSAAIGRVANCNGEYIAHVEIELQDERQPHDWRENSGALLPQGTPQPSYSDDDLNGLWKPGYLRVFLSHKSEYKADTANLKTLLERYGVSGFVAHEDIEPTKEWQAEIEKALFSMEVMIPLLSAGFRDSKWTDQEVGVAVGRGVPVVPVRLGTDPYGLIGKYQGLRGGDKNPFQLAKALVGVLFTRFPGIKDRLVDAMVTKLEETTDFYVIKDLLEFLLRLEHATLDVIDRLGRIEQTNSTIRNSYKVKNELPSLLARLKGNG